MIWSPQCAFRRHFNSKNRAEETCTAFPEGIPADILANRFDHTAPYPDDAGIRFEGKDEIRAQRQARIFAGRSRPVVVTSEKQPSPGQ